MEKTSIGSEKSPLLSVRSPGAAGSLMRTSTPTAGKSAQSKAVTTSASKKAIPPTQSMSRTAGGKRIARAQKRELLKPDDSEHWTGRLSMYCVCTSFDIPMLLRFFREHSMFSTRRLGQDVVHVRKMLAEEPTIEDPDRETAKDAVWWSGVEDKFTKAAEIFLFSYGVVSIWGLSEGGEWDILDAVKPFREQDFETPEESECFLYSYTDNAEGDPLLQITQDVLYLSQSLGSSTEDMVRAKLAISYGMAQSAKLATFESSVDSIFDRVGHLPIIMAQTGKLKLTDQAILKLSGELLAYSAYINLQTDVLDTPDWFWDNETYEQLYDKVARYLDVRHRVDIVNQRLGVLSEMYALFREERHILYGHRLEWIVIWLIVAEVVLDLVELAVLIWTGK